MNLDLAILRAAIAGITQLIAGRGLRVTQQGTQAYVEKCPRTNKPIRVNIPHLPDNASPALIRAVQGFIDHECGHILDTDYDVWREMEKWAEKEGKQAAFTMWNIVEDTFIERAMAKRFPGVAHNLEQLHEFFLAEITMPALLRAVGDHAMTFNILIVPMARAWAGQAAFERFMADKWHLVADEVTKIGALKDRFPRCKSSADTAALAKDLYRALYEKPPEPPKAKPKPEKAPPAPKPPKPEPADEPGDTGADGAPSDVDEGSKAPEPKAEPEPKPKKEPKAKKPKPEPKEDDDADTEAAGDGAADDADDDLPDLDGDGGAEPDPSEDGEPADGADDGEPGADDDEVGEGSSSSGEADDDAPFDPKGTKEDTKILKLHRRVLRARYDKKKSFAEIAERLRRPEQYVVQLHDEALARISANIGA